MTKYNRKSEPSHSPISASSSNVTSRTVQASETVRYVLTSTLSIRNETRSLAVTMIVQLERVASFVAIALHLLG
jgi:hypothetical protein